MESKNKETLDNLEETSSSMVSWYYTPSNILLHLALFYDNTISTLVSYH